MLSSLLDQAKRLFAEIEVNEEKMLQNMEALRGLILSERIMLHLAEKVGRQSAHEIIYRVSATAIEKGVAFKDALLEQDDFRKHFDHSEAEAMLDLRQYIGLCGQIVDDVLAMTEKERQGEKLI